MIKRALILVTGLTFSAVLNAATEFENGMVPIELARDGNAGGNFYSSLPDNFPLVALPTDTGLSVIGSVVRGSSQFVLLRNARSGAEARETLVAAYTAAGWINLAGAPRATLCHDQHGIMEINTSDAVPGENRVYVYRSLYPVSGLGVSLNCAQLLANSQSGEPTAILNFIRGLLPVFELPEGTVGLPNVFPVEYISGGFGFPVGPASSFAAHQNYFIEIPDITMPELHEHFMQQLEEQGWAVDSNGIGEFSASSIGFNIAQSPATATNPAVELKLTGFMTLLNIEDDRYRVEFKLQAGNGNTPGIIGIDPINFPSLGIRGIPSGYAPFPAVPAVGIRGIPSGYAAGVRGVPTGYVPAISEASR
jgi:hypothetical protein